MSQQLPLPMRLRPASVFASFCVGDNQHTVAALRALRRVGSSPVLMLHGPAGSGKTHLLQALCVQAGEQAAAYLPLAELQSYGPELLAGTQHLALLCLDDVQVIAADMAWNRALFSAHREFEERNACLVLASNVAPAALTFALPDWSSRLLAGNVLRLKPLDEDDQLRALQIHATQRGFELPQDVGLYLLRRLPRDMARLCQMIDDLDVALLAAQRKLTMPFVRQWLQAV